MISEELQKKIDLLPQTISDYLGSEEMVDVIIRLSQEFNLTHEQIVSMNDVIYSAFVKDIKIEDIFPNVKEKLALDEDNARAITILLLRDIFYVARDFFPGIDDEILKLGGELPKGKSFTLGEQFRNREEEIEAMQAQTEEAERERMADTIIKDTIDNLMAQFPEAGEMVIGSQNSIAVKNMPLEMKPLIKYWIRDYKDKMGYYKHSNLERVQYVCHDKNTRNMNEEERRQLNLVLKSADGEIELPYSTKKRKIDFALIEEE